MPRAHVYGNKQKETLCAFLLKKIKANGYFDPPPPFIGSNYPAVIVDFLKLTHTNACSFCLLWTILALECIILYSSHDGNFPDCLNQISSTLPKDIQQQIRWAICQKCVRRA